jgi:hypothetical protein
VSISSLWGCAGGRLQRESEADAMGPEPAVPYLTARHTGGTKPYLSCLVLDATGFDPASPLGVEATVRDDRVTLNLPGLPRVSRFTPLDARALPPAVRP